MTTCEASLSAELKASVAGPTLADVFSQIADFSEVTAQAKQNMRSAIRTFCRVLDRTPELVPISAPAIRSLADLAVPGAHNVSMRRWNNVMSDLRRAIKLSGFVEQNLSSVPLTADWEQLACLADGPTPKSILRRLGKFCSAHQISPADVDDDVLKRYFQYLDVNQLSKSPKRSHDDAVRVWNRYVIGHGGNRYQKLSIRPSERRYTLAWNAFPTSLKAEVDAYHAAALHPDPLDPEARRPVRPNTIDQRDRQLRRLASAMVLSGVDVEVLCSLADIVKPDNLESGLRFFLRRTNLNSTTQTSNITDLALSVATHWVKLPDDEINKIKVWSRKLAVRQTGLTDKNKDRLRPFNDAAVVKRLLTLPDKIVKETQNQTVNSTTARRIQSALAIALLTVAPMRLSNLLRLDRQRHFRATRVDGIRALHIVIPAAEVKNDQDLEYPVPTHVLKLLDLYMTRYQPLLCRPIVSGMLFPGRKDATEAKQDSALRRQITDTIWKQLGLRINPHLFRHLGALLFLQRHPGHYEEVRRILGHKSAQTTLNFYAGLETKAAMVRFDDVILANREHSDSR